MKITKPKNDNSKSEISKAASSFFEEIGNGLDEMNSSLELHNKKNEKTKFLRNEIHTLNLDKIKLKVEQKHAKSQEIIDIKSNLIKNIDLKVARLNLGIDTIKKQCDLEAVQQS